MESIPSVLNIISPREYNRYCMGNAVTQNTSTMLHRF